MHFAFILTWNCGCIEKMHYNAFRLVRIGPTGRHMLPLFVTGGKTWRKFKKTASHVEWIINLWYQCRKDGESTKEWLISIRNKKEKMYIMRREWERRNKNVRMNKMGEI